MRGGLVISMVTDIKPWNATLTPQNRLIWLRLQGVLLMIWCRHFFEWIGYIFGNLITIDGPSQTKARLDFARILVITEPQEKINKLVPVDFEHIRYHVRVSEEPCHELVKQYPSSFCKNIDPSTSSISPSPTPQ